MSKKISSSAYTVHTPKAAKKKGPALWKLLLIAIVVAVAMGALMRFVWM